MSLLLTFLLGLFFAVGIIIIKITDRYGVIEHVSICLACGAMVALLCFDLIPEIIENGKALPIWLIIVLIAAGVGILKLIDLFVPDHGVHSDEHETREHGFVHIGIMSAVAITIHNVLEGMTVYNIASIDMASGISMGIGVGLHNIPMGMLIYAMIKDQRMVKKSLILLITVLSTFFGGLIMAGIHPILTEETETGLICLTSGMVIFIIIFELIPEIIEKASLSALRKKEHLRSAVLFAVGFALVFFALLL